MVTARRTPIHPPLERTSTPRQKCRVETAKAECDHKESESSDGELFVLVYRAHISRVMRTAARISPDARRYHEQPREGW